MVALLMNRVVRVKNWFPGPLASLPDTRHAASVSSDDLTVFPRRKKTTVPLSLLSKNDTNKAHINIFPLLKHFEQLHLIAAWTLQATALHNHTRKEASGDHHKHVIATLSKLSCKKEISYKSLSVPSVREIFLCIAQLSGVITGVI